jgi:hypothetical protein
LQLSSDNASLYPGRYYESQKDTSNNYLVGDIERTC